jgi:hypothetical protein
MKARLALLALAALLAAALAFAGCGGSGDGNDSSGNDSSGADPASYVPKTAPVYVEATLLPSGETKSNIEALAKNVAGIDDLGGLIVEELEKAGGAEGEEFEYGTEIEPWLGEKVGLYIAGYDGEEFKQAGLAVQTTNPDEAKAFIEKHAKTDSGEPYEEAEIEGEEVWVNPEEGEVLGVVGEAILFSEDEASFAEMIKTSEGDESLAEQEKFKTTVEKAPDGSFAEVYVDIGGVIKEAGGTIDQNSKLLFETTGIDPTKATAVASLVPHAEQIEIDFSSNLSNAEATTGDASSFLEELPAAATLGFAAADFGKRLSTAIDSLDEQGIPGQIPPHELKKGLKEAGIDLESIADSIGDLGFFIEGTSTTDIGGALVLGTTGNEAQRTVANLGLLLRATGQPGVTALKGNVSGFTIPNEELGGEPIVIAASGSKLAIGLGLKSATAALKGSGETLGQTAGFEEAKAALGDTPIAAYVDAPAILQLIEGGLPAAERPEFEKAKPYLQKIAFAAIGSEESGGYSTAKMILGFTK